MFNLIIKNYRTQLQDYDQFWLASKCHNLWLLSHLLNDTNLVLGLLPYQYCLKHGFFDGFQMLISHKKSMTKKKLIENLPRLIQYSSYSKITIINQVFQFIVNHFEIDELEHKPTSSVIYLAISPNIYHIDNNLLKTISPYCTFTKESFKTHTFGFVPYHMNPQDTLKKLLTYFDNYYYLSDKHFPLNNYFQSNYLEIKTSCTPDVNNNSSSSSSYISGISEYISNIFKNKLVLPYFDYSDTLLDIFIRNRFKAFDTKHPHSVVYYLVTGNLKPPKEFAQSLNSAVERKLIFDLYVTAIPQHKKKQFIERICIDDIDQKVFFEKLLYLGKSEWDNVLYMIELNYKNYQPNPPHNNVLNMLQMVFRSNPPLDLVRMIFDRVIKMEFTMDLYRCRDMQSLEVLKYLLTKKNVTIKQNFNFFTFYPAFHYMITNSDFQFTSQAYETYNLEIIDYLLVNRPDFEIPDFNMELSTNYTLFKCLVERGPAYAFRLNVDIVSFIKDQKIPYRSYINQLKYHPYELLQFLSKYKPTEDKLPTNFYDIVGESGNQNLIDWVLENYQQNPILSMINIIIVNKHYHIIDSLIKNRHLHFWFVFNIMEIKTTAIVNQKFNIWMLINQYFPANKLSLKSLRFTKMSFLKLVLEEGEIDLLKIFIQLKKRSTRYAGLRLLSDKGFLPTTSQTQTISLDYKYIAEIDDLYPKY
ncbi:hypothetical protein DLAC_00379 [Tieghemostelium lacteum]|uniref:Uncharacterized protein n=1 Tax=Tieghemostelium lacteum TaxID=361077 RepID=A0A152A9K2_TIELA|nr:hypothetical protein DLAC_00379 [Tieghemostelium lacteum]|eukprot:KYR02900.1 hypothetical protein DLAC_00379 [Tieghemostelium lacteum]